MTTDPTQSEKWREVADELWEQRASEGLAKGSFILGVKLGYLAAQPKRPSVEEVARVLDAHCEEGPARELVVTDEDGLIRSLLALFESPAHDRETRT